MRPEKLDSQWECLKKIYPVPESAVRYELFHDRLDVDSNMRIQLMGVVFYIPDYGEETLVGSAASVEEDDGMVLRRAYFEALERWATIKLFYPHIPRKEEQKRLPSRSNGVAIHENKEFAQQAAVRELLERHDVLRSWYNQSGLKALEFPVHKSLEPFYDFHWAQLQGRTFVLAGFPKNSDWPFVFSSGLGDSEEQSLEKTKREFYQKLAALKGEEPSDGLLDSPTPIFHLETYLRPENYRRIKQWIQGESKPIAVKDNRFHEKLHELSCEVRVHELQFSDRLLYLARASSKQALPLTFGRGYEFLPSNYPVEFEVHPIA